MFLSQFNTLASEVKCLRVIERRDLSNEQNTFKSKTIFYHSKTRLKPERATRPIPKRRRPLYATATGPIPKRRRPLYKADPEKKKASVRDSYKADPEKKKASVRDSYNVMACCIALALKSYRKMCMQHVYSTHVRKGSAQNHSLHMYSMHGDPTVVYSTCSPFSFVTCLLNIGVSSLI